MSRSSREIKPTQPKDSGELNFERGLYFFREGHPEDALKEFKLFLDVSKKKNDLEEMAISLNALGRVHASTGKWNEAIEFFKRSLNIYQTIDDDRGAAILYHDIGRIYFNLNRFDEAEDATICSLDLYEKIQEPEGVTSALGQLSQVQRKMGDLPGALATAERGLEYSNRTAIPIEEINFLADISNLYREIGNPGDALDFSIKALQLAQTSGDPRQAMVVLGQLGQLYRKINDFDTALRYSREGLTMARKLRDPNEAAIFLQDMGRIYLERKEFHLAEENFLESLDLFEQLVNIPGVVYNYKSLSLVKFREGDHRSVISYYLQALRSSCEGESTLFSQTVLDFFPAMRNLMMTGTFREVTIGARGAYEVVEDAEDELLKGTNRAALCNSMKAIELFAIAGGDPESSNTREAIRLAIEVDQDIQLGLTHYFKSFKFSEE